jgi:prepilin-type N-terminal cleavage/methylation domain-containing protein
MKPKLKYILGFTIIELLVVLSIMGIVLTLFLVNLAGLRGARNTKLAQNKLVTDIRKIQSNTLSSRDVLPGTPSQIYVLKLDLANPRQYQIQVIYDINTSPKLMTVETVYFPPGVRFSVSQPIVIDRPEFLSDRQPQNCALIAYKAPFAKSIMTDGCSVGNPVFNSDSYQSLKNFVTNTEASLSSTDSVMTIKITDESGQNTRTVIVNGISGLVSFQ